MSSAERIAIIEAIFGCPTADAVRLEPLLRTKFIAAGKTIFHQGDAVDSCHFVVSGAAALQTLGSEGQLTRITTIEPGESFGAYPLEAELPVEVMAREAVEMLVITSAQLHALAQQSSAIASGLAVLFARQLATTLGRLAARVTLSAKGRVHGELLAQMGSDGRITPIPIVSALAVQAQTTRETASRAVSDLERRGILERERDGWCIRSPRMLEDLVV